MSLHRSQPLLIEAAHSLRVRCASPRELSLGRLDRENKRLHAVHCELASVRRAFFLGGLFAEGRLFFILG